LTTSVGAQFGSFGLSIIASYYYWKMVIYCPNIMHVQSRDTGNIGYKAHDEDEHKKEKERKAT
jgi:hypothetical protein